MSGPGNTFQYLAGSYVREDGTVGMLARGDTRPKDAAKGELARLDKLGAFTEPEAPSTGTTPDEVPTSPDQVLAWMEAKQKVSDVIAMVGDDAAFAKAALEAEGSVTGGEPRKSLKEALDKVIAAAAEATPPADPPNGGGEGEGSGAGDPPA